jgi:hypothetical protein
LATGETLLYIAAQIFGGIAGTVAAHLMFGLPLIDPSLKIRTGGGQWFAECVATFGLVATILAGIRFERSAIPWLVGLYITAAYWFTASTSFANPAVAIARSLTNSFSGIRPIDLPGFVAAELVGAACAVAAMTWLLRSKPTHVAAGEPTQALASDHSARPNAEASGGPQRFTGLCESSALLQGKIVADSARMPEQRIDQEGRAEHPRH